jgi:hypothetical protein
MTGFPRQDQPRADWFYVLFDAKTGEVIHSEASTSVVTDTPTPVPRCTTL